jgi:hypothetical protein
MLTYRDDVIYSVALAEILRHELGLPRVVADGHAGAADAADNQTL